jgi:hypothetical protein
MISFMNTWKKKVKVFHTDASKLDAFIANYQKIKGTEKHTQLQADLIKQFWQNHPDLYNNISNE